MQSRRAAHPHEFVRVSLRARKLGHAAAQGAGRRGCAPLYNTGQAATMMMLVTPEKTAATAATEGEIANTNNDKKKDTAYVSTIGGDCVLAPVGRRKDVEDCGAGGKGGMLGELHRPVVFISRWAVPVKGVLCQSGI